MRDKTDGVIINEMLLRHKLDELLTMLGDLQEDPDAGPCICDIFAVCYVLERYGVTPSEKKFPELYELLVESDLWVFVEHSYENWHRVRRIRGLHPIKLSDLRATNATLYRTAIKIPRASGEPDSKT